MRAWLGRMMPQTLTIMMVPNIAPMWRNAARSLKTAPSPAVNATTSAQDTAAPRGSTFLSGERHTQ